jgi:hypothetical protein
MKRHKCLHAESNVVCVKSIGIVPMNKIDNVDYIDNIDYLIFFDVAILDVVAAHVWNNLTPCIDEKIVYFYELYTQNFSF